MKQCAWCGADFDGGRGQIYCSVEHRLAAINAATIKRKRDAKRERRRKASKTCTVCGTRLSMYGEGNTCSLHVNPIPIGNILNEIKRMK